MKKSNVLSNESSADDVLGLEYILADADAVYSSTFNKDITKPVLVKNDTFIITGINDDGRTKVMVTTNEDYHCRWVDDIEYLFGSAPTGRCFEEIMTKETLRKKPQNFHAGPDLDGLFVSEQELTESDIAAIRRYIDLIKERNRRANAMRKEKAV